jgi:hypothetical protein
VRLEGAPKNPYSHPELKILNFEQASLFLVGHAWNGGSYARDLLEQLFPLNETPSYKEKNCAMDTGNIGDVVWYVVGTTRQKAKITGIHGSTHAIIKLLTGPQTGREFEAPWGIIEPCPEANELTTEQREKLRDAIKVRRVESRLDGKS